MNLLAGSASCLHLWGTSSFALLSLNYRHLKSRVRELQKKRSSKRIEKEENWDDADLSIMTCDIHEEFKQPADLEPPL